MLAPEVIEQQFLNALSSKYALAATYSSNKQWWSGVPTKQSLTDLGSKIIASVPLKEQAKFGAPLLEGFNNLCLSLITKALDSEYFEGKFVTAVGKTEWADIKWNDQSIAEKKNVINQANLVFISSESPEEWHKAKQSLTAGGVNNLLLDCSDAHAYASAATKDRLGNCFTWVKADPTFEGLLQVLHEPDERIYVGDIPPQTTRVAANKTKYIESLEIHKKPTATLAELWFDNTIPINSGLVAIIGNKGKGKSALTDIIGLLCNTRQSADFTFLSDGNFRRVRDNKSKHFSATLKWESGVPLSKDLEETVDEQQPELVKYIPQNFLEKICTQLGRIDESEFDHELKKVIFSHVGEAERLAKTSLDELIHYKTSESNGQRDVLKQELHKINESIVALGEALEPTYKQRIENLLKQKNEELASHDASKPVEVVKPESDPAQQEQSAAASKRLEELAAQISAFDGQVITANQSLLTNGQQIALIDRIVERIQTLQRQIQTFTQETENELAILGFTLKDVFTHAVTTAPLIKKKSELVSEREILTQSIDVARAGSIAFNRWQAAQQLTRLQNTLDEPNRRYQENQRTLKSWSDRRTLIVGDAKSAGSIRFYEAQLKELAALPEQLTEANASRVAKAMELHSVIGQLVTTYRDLYAPVNSFIETRPLAKDKFQLNFEVGVVDAGFSNTFFDFISQGIVGTFCGVEPGQKALTAILAKHDFLNASSVEAFLSEIVGALYRDRRPDGKEVRIGDQLRKGKSLLDLYDFIFGLDYLKPRFALRMGDKELSQLSPGERGTLLLVFYLLVDKDDIPLIIDQPEENLDNQTVFDLLVPCMKEAKQRRQIFIVTHNPNLAVVCDADQVIHADLDKKDNCRMRYLTGAIENPAINKAIVDILEGTKPAFENRGSKYI
jgi:ABC-type lipoprotein export system ATPase subunit